MSALRLAVRLGTVAVTCGALIIPGAAIANAAIAAPAHKGILPPKNPSKSLKPTPFFLASSDCQRVKDGAGCNTSALKAITHARKVLEKMAGMSFSLKAYDKLTAVEQLFVTVNLERVARGLAPAVVLTRSLDKVAQEGANTDLDPPLSKVPDPLPGGGRFVGLGGNWAGGWDNALGVGLRLDVRRRAGQRQRGLQEVRQARLLGAPGQHPRHVQQQVSVRLAGATSSPWAPVTCPRASNSATARPSCSPASAAEPPPTWS